MIILIYKILVRILLPEIGNIALSMLYPVVVIVLVITGITMLLGAVGMKVSTNLGSTIAAGIFRGIGRVGRAIARAIRWAFFAVLRLIPRVFNWTRQRCQNVGFSDTVSTVLAVAAVIALVIVII